jgi:hypothetical protein
MLPDFSLYANAPSSAALRNRGIQTFAEACVFVQQLPYARNTDKTNPLCVLDENCGTCSTKHALLKTLADENGHPEIELVLGIFKMNAHNTPAVADTLKQYQLHEMPEAHNYLRFNGTRYDFTKPGFLPGRWEPDLLEEITITPQQITTFKVNHHRAFLERWLQEHPEIDYDINEFWFIREVCITALSE